jgi:MFS family permease
VTVRVDHDAPASSLPGPFWRQWWASIVSNLGDGIAFAAMPLLAYRITDDERLLALTTVATLVPWLIVSIPAGVVIDRYDRRLLLVGADVARVALYAVIAALATTEGFSIWLLLGLLLFVGAFEVLFDSTAQAVVPMLVPRSQLQRANGLLYAGEVIAGSMIGLALGALLFDRAAELPFIVNAVSFAIAAILIAGIRIGRVEGHSVVGARLGAGLHWLRADDLLVLLVALLAAINFGLMLGQGIFVKFAADELGVTGGGYGVLLAVIALGAACGGLIGYRFEEAVGTTAAIVVPVLVIGVCQLVFWAMPDRWVVGVFGFVSSMAIILWNVTTVSIRQRIVAPDRFGRVNSVYRWIGTTAGAAGAITGGFVAYVFGLRAPYLIGAIVVIVAITVSLGRLGDAVAGSVQPAERTPAPPSIT